MDLPNDENSALVRNSLFYKEFLAERDEVLRHKWLESEKSGHDIGFEKALLDWIVKFRSPWRERVKNGPTISLNDDMNLLVQEIRDGISNHGCHVIHKEDLESIWFTNVQSDQEKRIMVENFASRYGFMLYLSPHLMMAVFRNGS